MSSYCPGHQVTKAVTTPDEDVLLRDQIALAQRVAVQRRREIQVGMGKSRQWSIFSSGAGVEPDSMEEK